MTRIFITDKRGIARIDESVFAKPAVAVSNRRFCVYINAIFGMAENTHTAIACFICRGAFGMQNSVKKANKQAQTRR